MGCRTQGAGCHGSIARCTQGTRRAVGWGLAGQTAPTAGSRLTSSAREHWEHPPHPPNQEEKGRKKPPRRVGKRIGSTSVLPLQAG